jgi:energy-coupling factor transport system substrate-specific component
MDVLLRVLKTAFKGLVWRRLGAKDIALMAVMIAVTTVFTLAIRVPIMAQEYLNFSDVAIVFASLAFGPWVGLVAGGVGTALADLVGGYAQWAPLSFLAHGVEGLAIGWLVRRRTLPHMLFGWAVGSLVMVAVYYIGNALFISNDWRLPLPAVLLNLGQAVAGALVGIPLYFAVRRAYPPVEQMGRPVSWTEEEPPSP